MTSRKTKNIILTFALGVFISVSGCGFDLFKPDKPDGDTEKNSGDGADDPLDAVRLQYDKCAAKNLAWVPGAKTNPKGECGDKLVSWCCKKATILLVFPAAETDLEERIGGLEKDDYKTYNCSQIDESNFKIHLLKIVDRKIDYTSVSVDNLEETPNSDTCSFSSKDVFGKSTTDTKDKNEYEDTIEPLMKKYCGGACHVASNHSISTYVDNQANVIADKADIIEQVTSGDMPQGSTMQEDDKQTLLDYLKAQ